MESPHLKAERDRFLQALELSSANCSVASQFKRQNEMGSPYLKAERDRFLQ